jgi:hypothetical protein
MESQSELDERILIYGMTTTGEIIPIAVDADGKIETV